jgi:hypothetical protein
MDLKVASCADGGCRLAARTGGKCGLQRDRKWDAIGTVGVVAERTQHQSVCVIDH